MWSLAAIRWGRTLVRNFTSDCLKPYNVPDGSWGANRAARLELAAAYRGLDQLGLNEGAANHLTVMAPRADGQGKVMLVINHGLHWREVTASNLVGVDQSGQTVEGVGKPDVAAAHIHMGIRRVRPDAKVVMHTHQPYATTLAVMKDPKLLMIQQNSLYFYQTVAYDTKYSGPAMAIEAGMELGQVLGDKDILFMGSHGIISVASTISQAFNLLYYLERAAMVQVLATAMQKELKVLPDSQCGPIASAIRHDLQSNSDVHFYAMYRLLRKSQPDFEL